MKAYDDIQNRRPALSVLIEYKTKLGDKQLILNTAVKKIKNTKVNISIAGVGSFTGCTSSKFNSLKKYYSLRGIMNRNLTTLNQ